MGGREELIYKGRCLVECLGIFFEGFKHPFLRSLHLLMRYLEHSKEFPIRKKMGFMDWMTDERVFDFLGRLPWSLLHFD